MSQSEQYSKRILLFLEILAIIINKNTYLLLNSPKQQHQPIFQIRNMSLQSSFFIPNSSSPNLMQTFNGKSYNNSNNDFMNQSSISKKQNSYKTQAISFLKTNLNNMIKDQLKAYRLQKKLQKEVQQFKRIKEKKQLVSDLHKIQKFRQKQSEVLKAKFDQYQKEKEKKDSLVQEVTLMKKQLIKRKKEQHDRKIQYVRRRFQQHQNEDIQNRLSRADSVTSHRSVHTKDHSVVTSRPRNVYTSLNQRRFIHHQSQDDEQKRITSYLKKMKHAESRIIEKEITNQERKQKSIKTEVKNLTKERNMKEENMMKEMEERLDSKMESFYDNFTRSQFENSNLLMNKSRMKEQLRERVLKNKEMNDSQLVNKTLDNFMKRKADKENLYRNHQRKIDLLRTKSSFMNTTIQIHKQELDKQSQRNIRILYEKLNKIKLLRPNETLTQKDRENLLNLLDTQDPMYPQMVEFLNNTKSEFLRKKLEKEQEKAKADKTKKTARFNNKN